MYTDRLATTDYTGWCCASVVCCSTFVVPVWYGKHTVTVAVQHTYTRGSASRHYMKQQVPYDIN
jgi:hypothetical protein